MSIGSIPVGSARICGTFFLSNCRIYRQIQSYGLAGRRVMFHTLLGYFGRHTGGTMMVLIIITDRVDLRRGYRAKGFEHRLTQTACFASLFFKCTQLAYHVMGESKRAAGMISPARSRPYSFPTKRPTIRITFQQS